MATAQRPEGDVSTKSSTLVCVIFLCSVPSSFMRYRKFDGPSCPRKIRSLSGKKCTESSSLPCVSCVGEARLVLLHECDPFTVPGNGILVHGVTGQHTLALAAGQIRLPQFGGS